MKKYRVEVSRVEYQLATVEVEAESEEEAGELAMECDSDEFRLMDADQSVESCKEINNE